MIELVVFAGENQLKAFLAFCRTLAWVDRQAARVPLVGGARRRVTDTLLDTIFGPEEDSDYVSTTAPSSPPPTHP